MLSDAWVEALGRAAPRCPPVAVCGPCIAGEPARRVPTLVVLSGRGEAVARSFAAWFTTPYPTCNRGRTGRFGALLGDAYSASAARAQMAGATLECLEALAVLDRALQLGGVRRAVLPLLSHLVDQDLCDATLAMPIAEFFPA